MKIELSPDSRFRWIARAERCRDSILADRAAEKADYEAAWALRYKTRGWLRYLIGPLSERPPPDDFDRNILSYYGACALDRINAVLRVLQNKDVGTIYLSSDEYRAITRVK